MSRPEILKALDAVLSAVGFARRGTFWNRRHGDLVDVVDVQFSHDRATSNVGVLVPHAYTTCWGEPVPAFVRTPECTVESRIGYLIGDTDRWWPIDSSDTPAALTGAVAAKGLSFLEGMHRPGAVEAHLSELAGRRRNGLHLVQGWIYLAALQRERGDADAACRTLATIRARTSGAWIDRLDELLVEFGCAGGLNGKSRDQR